MLEEIGGVHDRNHRVEARDFLQALPVFIGEGEGLRDGQRFGDACGLDEQVVKATLLGEARYFLEQVVAQGAADAAIGHLDEFFFRAAELSAPVADEFRVDVDLAHIVHDDRHAAAFAVVEDMVEERGFSGAEEAGENGDGELFEKRGRRFDGVSRVIS